MEDSNIIESNLSTFKIVFNNQVLQINYDISFKEYKTQTIDNVIQETLNKIGPKPLTKTSKDYVLFCSCGRPFNPNKLLSEAKCVHYLDEDYNEEKNKNEKFVLYEKEKEEKYEKYLSNYEIETILMKATGAQKIQRLSGLVPSKSQGNFPISDNLKKIIKEYYIKKERGNKILTNSYELKYDETFYNELLELGVPNNKIKAALRMTNNNKEEALLLATDETIDWNNKDYLFFENNEVMSTTEFNRLCKEEIKKEFPVLEDEEEITNRIQHIVKIINKENSRNNSIEDKNDSEDESSEEDFESSSEIKESINIESDSNLGSSSHN